MGIFMKPKWKFTNLSDNSPVLCHRVPVVVISLFGLIYFAIVFFNHYFFRTFCFDYGVYNFAFYDFSHFRISDCPIYPTEHVSFLQDHLSFTFFIFIPIYWLFGWLTGTYTLLYIQTAIILAGGWYVYKLVCLEAPDKLLPILALVQYFIIYGRWTALGADCNLAIIASSVVPVFMYFFEKRNFGFMYLVFLFILITREDMALWTLFIGLFLLIKHFRDREYRIASITVMALSVLYFVLAFTLLIPSLENEYKKFNLFNYAALGANPWKALVFMISNPIETIKLFFINTTENQLFDGVKFEFYYVYLICGGFLLFFRPVYLLLFIPILAKKMLNDEPLRWSIETYYSVEFVSMLPVAVFLILSEFKAQWIRWMLTATVCAGTVFITIYKLQGHKDRSLFWDDRKFAFFKSSFYKSDFSIATVTHQLEQIPPGALVSASGTMVTHLAWRPEIYNFPKVKDADYIAVFTDRDTYPLSQEEFESSLSAYFNDENWNVLTDDFPLMILKRNGKDGKHVRPEKPKIQEYSCDAESLSQNGTSFTSASGLFFDNADRQSTDKVHGGENSIALTGESPYGMTTVIENVNPGERFEVSVWRLSRNDFGKIVVSSGSGKIYYDAECHVTERDENGWELLKKKIIIPRRLPEDKLKIYLWNNGSGTIYFDDLNIVREYR